MHFDLYVYMCVPITIIWTGFSYNYNVGWVLQLELCLDQRQKHNMLYTSGPHSETRHETETTLSYDDFQRCDKQAF